MFPVDSSKKIQFFVVANVALKREGIDDVTYVYIQTALC